MSPPVWAQPFPGGVVDAGLQHALWRSGNGQIVALSLADGQVRWRSGEPLWPLLVGHGLAVGLTESPARVVALELLGAGAGRERWRSEPLPWPDGVVAPPGNAASALHAGWLDDSILLCWQLRPVYTGGAAPGASRAKPAARVGSCLLDAKTGVLQSTPADLDGLTPQALTHFIPSDDPSVLAQTLLGGVTYRLQRQSVAGDKGRIALSAQDNTRGLDLWSSTLEEVRHEQPGKGPRALRS
jgi:hypothetical protein